VKYSAETIGKQLRFEREKRNWTQKELGSKVGITGKQISNYEQGIPTPPIDMLLNLCETFDCELGYILGEEDYSQGSRMLTEIRNATGLTLTSIDAIRKITGTDSDCIEFGYEVEKYRRVLNSLLSSQYFIAFMECAGYLDDRISIRNNIDVQLEEKYGSNLLSEAHTYLGSAVDCLHDTSADSIKPELYEAIGQIEYSIDKKCDLDFQIKVARYELRESFESLMKDIYPRF